MSHQNFRVLIADIFDCLWTNIATRICSPAFIDRCGLELKFNKFNLTRTQRCQDEYFKVLGKRYCGKGAHLMPSKNTKIIFIFSEDEIQKFFEYIGWYIFDISFVLDEVAFDGNFQLPFEFKLNSNKSEVDFFFRQINCETLATKGKFNPLGNFLSSSVHAVYIKKNDVVRLILVP